jgi:nitrogen regulatory protein P-II 2
MPFLRHSKVNLPKIKLEIAIKAEMLDLILKAIINAAQSGKIGDGKIFVRKIQQAIRIRTSESGVDAL